MTNLLVEGPDAEGAFVATAYYFRLEPADTGARVAASGRIEQRVLPAGDRWRVVRHAIVSDF